MTDLEKYLTVNGIQTGEDEYAVTPATVIRISEIFGWQMIEPDSCMMTFTVADGTEFSVHQGTVH